MADEALQELGSVFADLGPDATEPLLHELVAAKRIALYGAGREGLMIRAFTMRLFHLGLYAHVVGDMTTPPLGTGDLLVVSAGPGTLAMAAALIGVAKEAGSRTLVITAQPDGVNPQEIDTVIVLPAQTMANDETVKPALLPMGSLFEAAELIFFDLVTLLLRDRLGQDAAQMRARHTNSE